MNTKKNLYPLKFIPIPEKKPWGGNALINILGKEFAECDTDGNETALTEKDEVGESWEIADMGFADSVVQNGWLAGNTIGELMETYIERISGEYVYRDYGRQFPVMVKFLDIKGKTSVQVNPDDEIARQRYDALGKTKLWYIMEASPEAKLYLGFRKETSASELYNRCKDGSITDIMECIVPKKGDSVLITPGTVHAAEGRLLVAEVQESSDLTFRLYDHGRKDTDKRPVLLEEAFDFIHMGRYDFSLYRKAGVHSTKDECMEISVPQFTVKKLSIQAPVKVTEEKSGGFSIYICIEGKAGIRVQENTDTETVEITKGETVLIPADVAEFSILPEERNTMLIEVTPGRLDDADSYIDPDTEPYLEGEDYEGIELEEEES